MAQPRRRNVLVPVRGTSERCEECERRERPAVSDVCIESIVRVVMLLGAYCMRCCYIRMTDYA